MRKITLMIFVVMSVFCFFSSAQATKWVNDKNNTQNYPAMESGQNFQCDCIKIQEIKKEFTSDNDREIWEIIKNGSEDDFSELISRYNQKSSDNHAKNIFGELFYKSIELMIIKWYALRFPENFSPEFFSGSELILLEEELQNVLGSLGELEKNCSSKNSEK